MTSPPRLATAMTQPIAIILRAGPGRYCFGRYRLHRGHGRGTRKTRYSRIHSGAFRLGGGPKTDEVIGLLKSQGAVAADH